MMIDPYLMSPTYLEPAIPDGLWKYFVKRSSLIDVSPIHYLIGRFPGPIWQGTARDIAKQIFLEYTQLTSEMFSPDGATFLFPFEINLKLDPVAFSFGPEAVTELDLQMIAEEIRNELTRLKKLMPFA